MHIKVLKFICNICKKTTEILVLHASVKTIEILASYVHQNYWNLCLMYSRKLLTFLFYMWIKSVEILVLHVHNICWKFLSYMCIKSVEIHVLYVTKLLHFLSHENYIKTQHLLWHLTHSWIEVFVTDGAFFFLVRLKSASQYNSQKTSSIWQAAAMVYTSLQMKNFDWVS